MACGETVIVAGIGCRRGCPAADIVALVQRLGGADALSAPDWKRDEPGVLQAAEQLGLPLRFVDRQALEAVQADCPTRSAAAHRAVGLLSVAEAAALAGGGRLLRPRQALGAATCALATHSPAIYPLAIHALATHALPPGHSQP